jgi:hypothetical protein
VNVRASFPDSFDTVIVRGIIHDPDLRLPTLPLTDRLDTADGVVGSVPVQNDDRETRV